MVKQNNTILYIIGIIILIIFLSNYQKQEEGMVGLKIRYYDKNKQEIFPQQRLFSIITPPTGPSFQSEYISFDVSSASLSVISSGVATAFNRRVSTTGSWLLLPAVRGSRGVLYFSVTQARLPFKQCFA